MVVSGDVVSGDVARVVREGPSVIRCHVARCLAR